MEEEVVKENNDLEERGSFKTDCEEEEQEEDKENIQDHCLDKTKEEDEEILQDHFLDNIKMRTNDSGVKKDLNKEEMEYGSCCDSSHDEESSILHNFR